MILVDAGPLVAILCAEDAEHARCLSAMDGIEDDVRTVWPVITEAMYLLRNSWRGQEELWLALEREDVGLLTLDHLDFDRMHELMAKFRDPPMDLADAALVRVAEREKIRRVFTLDRRDFSLYRPSGIGRFDIVP